MMNATPFTLEHGTVMHPTLVNMRLMVVSLGHEDSRRMKVKDRVVLSLERGLVGVRRRVGEAVGRLRQLRADGRDDVRAEVLLEHIDNLVVRGVLGVLAVLLQQVDHLGMRERHDATHARVARLDARHAVLAARRVEAVEHGDVVDVLPVELQVEAVRALERELRHLAGDDKVAEAIDLLVRVGHVSRRGWALEDGRIGNRKRLGDQLGVTIQLLQSRDVYLPLRECGWLRHVNHDLR